MRVIANDQLFLLDMGLSTSYAAFMGRFIAHAKARSFYNMPRFYISGSGQNFNTHQLVSLASDRSWYDAMEARVLELLQPEMPGYTHVREAVTSAATRQLSGLKFWPTNFLDPICVRAHVVLYGAGRVEVGGTTMGYARGDVLLFTQEDFGKETMFHQPDTVIHQVFSVSHESQRGVKAWDLFAQSPLYQELL